MPTPESLPAPLDRGPFSTADARRAGVRKRRLYRQDLARPFHGVRTESAPATDVRSRCVAFLPRLRPTQFFSHLTSARLHGLPIPMRLAEDERLHVSVRAPARAVRVAGAIGHQLVQRPGLVQVVQGLPAANPIETWCQLATLLTVDELIEVGDALVARTNPDAGRTWVAMQAAVGADDRPCVGRLRDAFAEVRSGVRSPGETRLRLLLVRSGLPQPLLNERILDGEGRFIAECDLVYPAAKLVIEYEGDYHRTDVRAFRNDIVRRERLEDAGCSVLRVTSDDVTHRRAETVARITRRLADRTERLVTKSRFAGPEA